MQVKQGDQAEQGTGNACERALVDQHTDAIASSRDAGGHGEQLIGITKNTMGVGGGIDAVLGATQVNHTSFTPHFGCSSMRLGAALQVLKQCR